LCFLVIAVEVVKFGIQIKKSAADCRSTKLDFHFHFHITNQKVRRRPTSSIRIQIRRTIDMADGEESDGSDEWGMEELVIPTTDAEAQEDEFDEARKEDEDYWKVEPTKAEPAIGASKEEVPTKAVKESEPMIIVDVTKMNSNIHSKYDKNSVNDSAAASALRKKIESEYGTYSKDASLLSDGTVIPCGSTVWREALVRLRDERPGHYFAPIFPPKK
jgi:hypothetical protein